MKEIRNKGPELFFGLVGAVGTDLDVICEKMKDSLANVGYTTEIITLSKFLDKYGEKLGIKLSQKPEDKRIISYMDAGDEFRRTINDGAALAILTLSYLRRFRKEAKQVTIPRQAYVFKSLKHKKEVERFREIYGKNFWLISVYSPKELREENLSRKIAASQIELDFDKCTPQAKQIIIRDEHDPDNEFGQNVRDTFPEGDVFINASDVNVDESINRFIELIFGNTFHTPTNEEFGMFHAFGSSLRSSSLARQVGATITTEEGDVISTGTNEVPKAGGGLYGPDSKRDFREWRIGFDSNEEKKKQLLKDVLQHLVQSGWLADEKNRKDIDRLVERASKSILKDSQLMNLTEFGREIHAEMAALVDAARRTINVQDCLLYCTTFPCHVCAKHIIAAGLSGVVYIEPYPKSLAKELFSDSLTLDEGQKLDKVNFRPFVGIHPRKYIDLFLKHDRKENGKKLPWINSKANPRYSEPKLYLGIEVQALKQLNDKMKQTNLKEKKLEKKILNKIH